MIAKRAPGPPAGLHVLRARAFRRVRVSFKYLPRLQGGSAGPSSPYGRRPASGAGGIRGPGTLWSTAHCCIMSENTFGMHEKQLGVELMRELCDPRGDCAWCPKWGSRVHHVHRRCSPTIEPSRALLDGRIRPYFRQRLGAGRPHDRRPCWRSIWGGLVRISGRCMRWEARGEYSRPGRSIRPLFGCAGCF